MSCQDRRSSAWAAAWHAMSPEVEVGGLVMSLTRWAMFRWNRDFEWILNLQKHTKNTPATATPQSLWQISGDFVPRKPCRNEDFTSTKTSQHRWPGSSCGAATIVAGQGPYWLRWLLYWGVSFFFLVCGLKNPKEAAIEQLGELEKLDRCTED